MKTKIKANEPAISPEQLAKLVRDMRAELTVSEIAIQALLMTHPEQKLNRVVFDQLCEEVMADMLGSQERDARIDSFASACRKQWARCDYAAAMQDGMEELRLSGSC